MVLRVKPGPLWTASKALPLGSTPRSHLHPTSACVCWHWWENPSLSYLHSPHNDGIFTWAQAVWDSPLSECLQGHHYWAFCVLSHLFYQRMYVGSTAKTLTVQPLRVQKQLVSSNFQLFLLSECMCTNVPKSRVNHHIFYRSCSVTSICTQTCWLSWLLVESFPQSVVCHLE